MNEYILYVHCGSDSGEHDRGNFEDDQSAIRTLVASALSLHQYYPRIQIIIKEGDRIVHDVTNER